VTDTLRDVAGLVHAPWEDLRGQDCELTDATNDLRFIRSGDDLVDGLFVQVPAWGWHLFQVQVQAAPAGRDANPTG
jgi:hypothetical protein